jgi:hypothetical protein
MFSGYWCEFISIFLGIRTSPCPGTDLSLITENVGTEGILTAALNFGRDAVLGDYLCV